MFTVTRQHQHPDGLFIVEVSQGDINFCNPDALSARYRGEFEEFADPREAVQTAIEIARMWRKDSGKNISIGIGATHGNTMPFEPIPQRDAIAWAKKHWESLPKCACGEPLPEKRKRYRADDWSGEEFCSEHCAEREIEFQAQQQAELDAETEQTDEQETV